MSTDNSHISQEQNRRLASTVKLLLLDVDGVLTDGQLYFSTTGEEMKTFNTQDGHGIRMLLENQIQVGIITGRNSSVVANRARDLGISILYQGQKDKVAAFEQILQDGNYSADETAYAGDDFPDLPVMGRVGLSIAVANAHADVQGAAAMITDKPGGFGAVREISDFILKAQGRYDAYLG